MSATHQRLPTAFVASLFLHGLFVVVFMLLAYSAGLEKRTETQVFELVQGEGDNFAATEAPALGVPGGIKLNLPPAPAPVTKPEIFKPEPEQREPPPVTVEPPAVTPPTPAPLPKPVETKAPPETKSKAVPVPTKSKTMAEQIRWQQIVAESKAKQKAKREKAAEEKRLAAERVEKAKRDKAAAAAATKSPRIDAKGIAKGVLGGSTANETGGAGGTALSRADGPVLDAYFALLRERLLKALDKPPGLSDTLVAEAEFRINADGSITGVKILDSSGSAEFDRAVLGAYSRVRMPARPDGKSTVHSLTFRTKDLEGN